MTRLIRNELHLSRQQGAALIVSLIILAVITLMGVAGMQSSSLETKLANTSRDRAFAFEAAEATIREAEASLIASPPSRKMYFKDCPAETGCFKADCSGGLCFKGGFSGENITDCSLLDVHGHFEQIDNKNPIWGSDNVQKREHVFYTEPNKVEKDDVEFVVEFACFTQRQTGNILQLNGQQPNPEDYSPVLRVIAQATGPAKRATVTLQTTIKLND